MRQHKTYYFLGRITCPKCRKDMTIPADGLVTNFALNQLIEEMSGLSLVTIIESSNMPVEMQSTAKRVVLKAVNDNNDKQSPDKEREIAAVIVDKFNAKYGEYWHCIVIDKNVNSFGASLPMKQNITLEVHNSRFHLFKSQQDTPCWKCDDASCDGTNCKLVEPQIVEIHPDRTKDPRMIEEAKRVVLQAIKEKESVYHAAIFVKGGLDKKYGGNWTCIINKIGENAFNFRAGFYINMNIGKLNVRIFKQSCIHVQ